MLIRMSSGASIDLSQMPDPSVAHSLRLVFDALGCKCLQGNDEWKFEWSSTSTSSIFIGVNNGGGSKSHDAELALIHLAKKWMDEGGVDMEAIESFEKPKG